MLDPKIKSNTPRVLPSHGHAYGKIINPSTPWEDRDCLPLVRSVACSEDTESELDRSLEKHSGQRARRRKTTARPAKRRSLPKNFLLKRLDLLYWQRLLRYLYIRFVRMQGSPEAIARGVAAGVFAGSFPLLGFQTLIGVAIAAILRGNKVMAAVGTWISNPFTYLPIFALNFYVGRWILGIPASQVALPADAALTDWMSMGMSVTTALMVGSFVVGLTASILSYYIGLATFYKIRRARRRYNKGKAISRHRP